MVSGWIYPQWWNAMRGPTVTILALLVWAVYSLLRDRERRDDPR